MGIGLRVALLIMLLHVRAAGPEDPRFETKGIGDRALLVVPIAWLAVPLLWRFTARRREPFPWGVDALLVSVVALDLGGNVLDLYDRYRHFDLIPHAHGSGALTVVIAWLLRVSPLRAILLATAGHTLLEVQEIASDQLFGFRNVRGWWDTAGDLAVGLAGSLAYLHAYRNGERRAPSESGRRSSVRQ